MPLSHEELFAEMPRLQSELGALIVPTLGVPITPNPAGYVFSHVKSAMDAHLETMRRHAEEVVPFIFDPHLEAIPRTRIDDVTPYWANDQFNYFPAGDARLAYAIVARYRPNLIIEIGCGNSTKFMRRAIRDHATGTRIVSIDAHPREPVAAIVDEFIEATLQDVDLRVFNALAPGDILFMDGSHLVMNGSDCVHFFLNLLPTLPPGIWVHIHDVFLPYDYPYKQFIDCKSNEQYMVAMLLLHGRGWIPVFPIYYAHECGILPHGGGSFWMRREV